MASIFSKEFRATIIQEFSFSAITFQALLSNFLTKFQECPESISENFFKQRFVVDQIFEVRHRRRKMKSHNYRRA